MEQEPSFESEQEEHGGKIADVLRKLGEDNGFDDETCDEVASMPFTDAFEAAYGYLTQAGLDPDEELASFMEDPES